MYVYMKAKTEHKKVEGWRAGSSVVSHGREQKGAQRNVGGRNVRENYV